MLKESSSINGSNLKYDDSISLKSRLIGLDYLRGLSAFAILIYHFSIWSFGGFSSNNFLGRVGVYGISIFYILSGLTLYYIYFNNLERSEKSLLAFGIKRIFRIFPLFWLATICTIILSGDIPSLYELFLNLTGLFGFLSWDSYLAVGAWSIGNELTFYFLLPFLIFSLKKSKIGFVAIVVFSFTLFVFFAFYLLDEHSTLNDQWVNYINPFNQVFLFVGGFSLGFLFERVKIRRLRCFFILMVGLLIFCFYPTYGETIMIVTGINRLILTLSCFLICLAFFKMKFNSSSIFHIPLSILGKSSYSLYLLHPIVFNIVGWELFPIDSLMRFILSIIGSLCISYIVYTYFEKYFIRMSQKRILR